MGCLKLTYEASESTFKIVYGELYEQEKSVQRWWSPDPIVQPWQSNYSAMDGNPIYFTDVLGLSKDGPKDRNGTKAGKVQKGDYKVKKPKTPTAKADATSVAPKPIKPIVSQPPRYLGLIPKNDNSNKEQQLKPNFRTHYETTRRESYVERDLANYRKTTSNGIVITLDGFGSEEGRKREGATPHNVDLNGVVRIFDKVTLGISSAVDVLIKVAETTSKFIGTMDDTTPLLPVNTSQIPADSSDTEDGYRYYYSNEKKPIRKEDGSILMKKIED